MGSAVGGLISGGLGLAGSLLGGREARKGQEAAADAARFIPTNISTPFGSVNASMGNISATIPDELQQQYQGLLGFGQQRLQQAQDPAASLNFLNQSFGPELERQRLAQESRLFNQGLLGSTAGALQTEGLRTAQNQALLGAALSERDTAYSQGLGFLSGALDIANLPQSLISLSGNIGAQQASAGANVGNALAAAAQSRGNSINSIFSGLGQAAGSFIGRQQAPQPSPYLLGGTFLPNSQPAFQGTSSFSAPSAGFSGVTSFR